MQFVFEIQNTNTLCEEYLKYKYSRPTGNVFEIQNTFDHVFKNAKYKNSKI